MKICGECQNPVPGAATADSSLLLTEKKDSWTVLGDRLSDNGGDVEILSYQECMYTMNEGMTITEDWIQTFETFDAIVAVNDLSALGRYRP